MNGIGIRGKEWKNIAQDAEKMAGAVGGEQG